MALTERQQQIKKLLDQGKTPDEIAKQLKITVNAVYQQRRRIANGAKSTTRAAKSTGSRRTTRRATGGRKTASTRRRSAARPKPDAPAHTEPRAMTPLQAIRARRDAITAEVKAAGQMVAEAERVLKAANEQQAKAEAKVKDELSQLDAAESALTGKVTPATKPKRQSGRKPAANGRQGTGVVKTDPDPQGEAELAAAQAEQAARNGAEARQETARLAAAPDPAPESVPAPLDEQAALDGGAEFEELDGESSEVGVGAGEFEQPDAFGDEG